MLNPHNSSDLRVLQNLSIAVLKCYNNDAPALQFQVTRRVFSVLYQIFFKPVIIVCLQAVIFIDQSFRLAGKLLILVIIVYACFPIPNPKTEPHVAYVNRSMGNGAQRKKLTLCCMWTDQTQIKQTIDLLAWQPNYSIISMARTRMARLPWMIRTLLSVPTKFFQ